MTLAQPAQETFFGLKQGGLRFFPPARLTVIFDFHALRAVDHGKYTTLPLLLMIEINRRLKKHEQENDEAREA